MEHCQQCGAGVTKQFTRVFGDAENNIYACLECTTSDWLDRGAAANPDGMPTSNILDGVSYNVYD